ncbi:MAG: polysaccharide pyruvyl transferase family protein [Alphaproteobacteria bacterium]
MSLIKSLALVIGRYITRFGRSAPTSRNVIYVLPPASAGSLGDQALLAGLVNLIHSTQESQRIRQILLRDWHELPVPEGVDGALEVATVDTSSTLKYMISLIHCRHLVVLGADVMDGFYSDEQVVQTIDLCNLAAELGVPVSIVSFSFSDKPTDSAIMALKSSNPLITYVLRDGISHARFEKIVGRSAFHAADLAFQLKPDVLGDTSRKCLNWMEEQKLDGQTIIGFNANPLIDLGEGIDPIAVYARAVEGTLSRISGARCVFLPHDLRGSISDVSLLNEIYMKLTEQTRERVYVLQPEFNAWDVKGLVARVDLLVTGRMHLAIAALSQCVPVLGVGYQGKFEGLFDLFNLVEMVITPGDLIEEDKLDEQVVRALSRSSELRDEIASELPKVLKLSERNVMTLGIS